eukprot:GILI01024241.1.p1 GENE.GILI01024241.1~~GILI01024241.1.p1  ORF type:complete len:259 (-),score=65.67 GILI01024241.1:95-871(-)
MSYEPSKRLVLKNLPPDCTKKDIIDFIKNRSRSQPSNIELGKRPDGSQNRFAHVTVEGMKALCEVLNGIPIKGHAITAEPAKPHFSIAMRDAKRTRENEEKEAETTAAAAKEEMLERIRNGPPQLKGVKVKSFFYYKQKYAEAAKKIAEDGRKGLITRHSFKPPVAVKHSFENPPEGDADGPAVGWMTEAEVRAANPPERKKFRPEDKKNFKKEAKKKEAVVEAPPPPPPEPPKPSKEERKIAGLQAKLLALKAKMGK